MLEAAVVLELALGKYVEAAIIAVLLVFNAALGLFQESRAQATLAALKSRLALIASVRRDGAWNMSMLTGESVPIEAGAGVQTFAGALVRRGEALAEVTATGARTKFGRTAELVRTAHVVSSQQKAVLRVVRNLAGFNGVVIVLLVAYAWILRIGRAGLRPSVRRTSAATTAPRKSFTTSPGTNSAAGIVRSKRRPGTTSRCRLSL